MKCPLLSITKAREIGDRKEVFEDCLKEECAWWRPDHEECCLPSISYQLERLDCALVTVQNKMPPPPAPEH